MDQVTEQELAAVAVAPRVTAEDVDANIVTEYYINAGEAVEAVGYIDCHQGSLSDGEQCRQSLRLLTFCVITLRNGFTVTGESACASPENFDPEIGRCLARANAVNKIWPLMGYELRSHLMLASKVGVIA